MNLGNRTNFTNVNRTGVNNFNRTNVNNFNRTGITNVNRTNFNNFNRTNVNNFNRNFGGTAGWRANPYAGYHNNWVNGYWHGHYGGYGGYGFGNGGWGYGGWGYPGFGFGYGGLGYGGFGYGGLGYGLGYGLGGFGTGLALGALSSWAYGPMLYNWGYMGYSNPYYASYIQQPIVVASTPVYNYATPIDTQAVPPQDSVRDQSLQTFDSARDAFKQGDYAGALKLTDDAIAKLPGDSALHEFRALVLFALNRYDEAAAVLYSVLSVGPGWDWTTLIGLYPDIQTYTAQLRALEAYVGTNPNSAPARFVLAYQYLSQGHADAATQQFQAVARLLPSDKLSAQLLKQLTTKAGETPAAGETVPPNPVPATANSTSAVKTPAVPPGKLAGTWTAKPNADTTIELTIADGGAFTWKVTDKSGPRKFTGESTFGNNLLTLAPPGGSAMVGELIWTDNDHYRFKIVGGGPDDPGLSFSRAM